MAFSFEVSGLVATRDIDVTADAIESQGYEGNR